MIVEFTGLTGVGKSTLSSIVVRELRARGVSMTSSPRTPTVVKAVVAWRSVWALARACAWLGPRRLQLARRDGFPRRLWTYLTRAELCRRHAGVHIVDGGVTRLVMTLHMTGAITDSRAAWRGMAARMPTPDVIVLIDASDADITHRRAERGGSVDLRVPRPTRAERDALRSLRDAFEAGDDAHVAPRVIEVRSGHGDESRVAETITDAIIGAVRQG